MAETSLREQTSENPAWKTIAAAHAQAPTIAPKPKTVQGTAGDERSDRQKQPGTPN